jgi:hypothetical protein
VIISEGGPNSSQAACANVLPEVNSGTTKMAWMLNISANVRPVGMPPLRRRVYDDNSKPD